MKSRKTIFFAICFSFFSLFSCSNAPDYQAYLIGSEETQDKLKFLFETLSDQETSEGRFIINLEISRILINLKQNSLRNAYLLEQIQWYPDDFCNSFYLNIIADDYQSRKMPKMAEKYYKRIIRNYPPIINKGEELQTNVLEKLSEISSHPEERIHYSDLLLKLKPEDKKIAKTYYNLATAYETIGEWPTAISIWKKFLAAPQAGMEKEETLRKDISKKVRFYEYQPKDWAYRELDPLLAAIRSAISNRNNDAIKRNMSKIDFFTLSWGQDDQEANYKFVYDLATFIRRFPIKFNPKVERNANDTEAYWETYNWNYRIRTWYLYFQRIDFPADPSLHGKWEWAGIYFGEKPF